MAMKKTISQIRDEISNFYLSIQDEITDVATGSVSGGMIYALSASIKKLYDYLEELERQAYVSTASGTYLDLLIEGGFFLPRPQATRSRGYVLVYGDSPINQPDSTGNGLVCATYDYGAEEFLTNLTASTKFSGTNEQGSSSVTYSLIQPRNSLYYKTDSFGRNVIDLRGRKPQYLLLPVASILRGRQVNIRNGSLTSFTNPPSGLQYVSNVSNPGEIIFSGGGISSAPLYSRNTSMLSYNQGTNVFSVVNAFNFSTNGFLEISYQASAPTRLIYAVYRDSLGDEISGGVVFEYSSKNQTSISLKSPSSYIKRYKDNEFNTYNLTGFSYNRGDADGKVTYYVDSSDVWYADKTVTLPGGAPIGPATGVGSLGAATGSSRFFKEFFDGDNWVLQQRKEQVTDDLIFDPDGALTESYTVKEGFRLSTARDVLGDEQYRAYFKKYVNGLPRATPSALEFSALNVPGITFAKSLPQEDSPVGSAVILAASEDGQLSPDQRISVFNSLKDDWVSAGVNLVIRAPDLVEFKLSVSVTLENKSFENSVRLGIQNTVSSYLKSIQPGGSIKYGYVYSLISSLPGVRGVSKLILGRHNPEHYKNYPGNYSSVALQRMVEYNPELYSFGEDSVFEEDQNYIVISSDYNDGYGFTPVSYANYLTELNSGHLFSEYNTDVYGAVEGLFSSDGGGSILGGASHVYQAFTDIVALSENNVVNLSFNVDSSDAEILVSIAGSSDIDSGMGTFRTISTVVPSGTTGIEVDIYSSSDSVTVSGIQSFVHDENLDSYWIGKYDDLSGIPIIEEGRISFIFGSSQSSKRYKNLKIFSVLDEDEDGGRGRSLFRALIEASSLSLFQSIIRDYQYGTNVSGKNPGFHTDTFLSTTSNDYAFIHFLAYLTTAPFVPELASKYPLIPIDAQNRDISDYTTTSFEIVRFHQGLFNPSMPITPSVGIEIVEAGAL